MRHAARGAAALLLASSFLGCAGGSASPAPVTDASPPSTASQVMVTLPEAPPAIWSRTTFELEQTYRLRRVFAWTMGSIGEHCIVFEVPRGRSVQDILRRLGSDPRVGSAQPIATFDALGENGYNDPYAHLQHSVQSLQLRQAHRLATGKGVRVAVIDTGVDFDHPDLRGRVVKFGNFVERGGQAFTSDIHGTAVAGVIAAATNNQVGIVGVAPQAEIFALKACWQKAPGAREAICDSYTLAKAVDFAILQGAQVLNFSLAGPHDPLLARLISAALKRGIAVVAADAGDGVRSFPASLQGVIGVFGLDDSRPERKPRAPSGLGAPAVDILSTVPRASYDFFSGSSLAAAQVSGIAALLLEKNPRLTPAQIAELIRKSAKSVPPAQGSTVQVDACAALAIALGTGACS